MTGKNKRLCFAGDPDQDEDPGNLLTEFYHSGKIVKPIAGSADLAVVCGLRVLLVFVQTC